MRCQFKQKSCKLCITANCGGNCHNLWFLSLLYRAVGLNVVIQPMDQFVSMGETLRLVCNVSGSEPISYQWLKDGEQLQDDVAVNGSSTSVLMVEPVLSEDFGEYQCNASNDMDQVLSEVAVVTGEGSGGCCHGLGANLAQAAIAVLCTH